MGKRHMPPPLAPWKAAGGAEAPPAEGKKKPGSIIKSIQDSPKISPMVAAGPALKEKLAFLFKADAAFNGRLHRQVFWLVDPPRGAHEAFPAPQRGQWPAPWLEAQAKGSNGCAAGPHSQRRVRPGFYGVPC